MIFRPDIEGLRAVSVILVVAYHYFPAAVPGGYIGVDVFFVISGYLITQSLVDHSAKSLALGPWQLDFWARRARRLLPNALLVMLAASVVGLAALSDFSLKRLGSDVFWSATYSVNWLFVLRAVDYLQWDETANSALLNYWSLAIEEQFYLVWPGILYAALRFRPKTVSSPWTVAANTCLVLLGLSLAYCVWLSMTQLTLAFFSSPSRAWELLCGAWLALMAREHAASDAPGIAQRIVAVAALLVIPICGFLFSDDTIHPGIPTLLPVLASCAVIWFSRGLADSRAMAVLTCRPMQYLGSRSYSIYLWHWPVMVLGQPLLPAAVPARSLVLLALSWALAEAAYRWVETPARFRWGRGFSARRVATIALIASLAVAAVGLALRAAGSDGVRQALGLRAGGAALQLPPLRQVSADLPVTYQSGCHRPLEALDQPDCLHGDPNGGETAVLFGDSHAAQWFPALDIVARERSVRLHAWTKSGCPSADVSVWNQAARGAYRQCDAWRERIFERIERLRPRIVIVSNLIDDTTAVADPQGRPLRGAPAAAAFEDGLARTVARLRKSGAVVVMLRDTPRPRPDILDCLYAAASPSQCERTRAAATDSQPLDARAARSAGAVLWDLTETICPQGRCPVVRADPPQVVYRDSNHLSASFVTRLAPELATRWAQLPAGPSGRGAER